MESRNRPSNATGTIPEPRARTIPRVSSEELMHHQSELIIEHDGREYRLRVTHSGKLILTA
jgi:hemin uptake protein HemP